MKKDCETKKEEAATYINPAVTGQAQPLNSMNNSMVTADKPKSKQKFSAAGNRPPPFRTVDAETLLATPLPSLRYAIEGLLPQGLNLLAGSPKIGKSWLVLWLCLMPCPGQQHIMDGSKQGTA